jgi:alpha-galactosidase
VSVVFIMRSTVQRFRLGACFWLVAAARIALAQTSYEAETAVLSGGARVRPFASASEGQVVTGVGGEGAGRVSFNRVPAPRGGLYVVEIYFTLDDQRSITVTVNGETRLELYCQATGRPDTVNRTNVLIPLRAGNNVLTFDNPEESGPDLDRIVVQTNAVAAGAIGGVVNASAGKPLASVEICLSGGLESKTATDGEGRYSFPFVPEGSYYIRPSQRGEFFSPWEARVAASSASAVRQDFARRDFAAGAGEKAVMDLGPWRVEYDLTLGAADFFCNGQAVLRGAMAAARLPETVTSLDYKTRKATRQTFHDALGDGVRWIVVSANDANDEMTQTFCWRDGQDYITAEVEVARKPAVRCRFIAPLIARGQPGFLPAGDLRALFVPFDNDKWVRYDAVPFGRELTSYEVSAFYDNRSRQGLIAGSLEHDRWKTGVRSSTSPDAITDLEVFGGVTSAKTRDVLPHGEIAGETIRSPKIFLGCFSDWRDGLESYASANASLAPSRPWQGGTPFGWNSWGKMQFKLNYQKAVEVSDFFARELQPRQFQDDGVIYVGLDSGWNALTDQQLKEFVQHCQSNHQEAGIYFTPFAAWGPNDDARIAGTDYKYKDIYLYAHGQKQRIASGVALDPTHPGTQKLIELNAQRFRQAGFKYVKADFLVHGALEADRHYDPGVSTGLEAYNEGMKFVAGALGGSIFLNLSIAPLFPSQYANSRRIACDAFGDIGQTEYTLNSLTYGWWLSKMYDFSDPDQMVFDGYTEGENRARVSSAVVTGLMLAGDDFSAAGSETGKERARQFLTHSEVNALARVRKSFRPVEGNTGCGAAHLFVWQDEWFLYLAAFNYSRTEQNFSVDFNRIGLKTAGPIEVKELWSGVTTRVASPMPIKINPADAAIYKFSIRAGR